MTWLEASEPVDALDVAVQGKPGEGLRLTFTSTGDRERFRWRCYAAMATEARLSRKELEPSSPGWGKHPWKSVKVVRQGALALWIGRRLDNEVTVVEGVTQEAED